LVVADQVVARPRHLAHEVEELSEGSPERYPVSTERLGSDAGEPLDLLGDTALEGDVPAELLDAFLRHLHRRHFQQVGGGRVRSRSLRVDDDVPVLRLGAGLGERSARVELAVDLDYLPLEADDVTPDVIGGDA